MKLIAYLNESELKPHHRQLLTLLGGRLCFSTGLPKLFYRMLAFCRPGLLYMACTDFVLPTRKGNKLQEAVEVVVCHPDPRVQQDLSRRARALGYTYLLAADSQAELRRLIELYSPALAFFDADPSWAFVTLKVLLDSSTKGFIANLQIGATYNLLYVGLGKKQLKSALDAELKDAVKARTARLHGALTRDLLSLATGAIVRPKDLASHIDNLRRMKQEEENGEKSPLRKLLDEMGLHSQADIQAAFSKRFPAPGHSTQSSASKPNSLLKALQNLCRKAFHLPVSEHAQCIAELEIIRQLLCQSPEAVPAPAAMLEQVAI